MPVPESADTLASQSQSDDGGSDVRLSIEPNERFFLFAAPTGWEWDPTLGRFLPALICQRILPGSSGMRTLGEGEEPEKAYAEALESFRRRGYTLIDPKVKIPANLLPAGVEPGSYRRVMACKGPRSGRIGHCYFEAWDVPARKIAGLPQRFDRDQAKYNEWRAQLVDSGVIADIPDVVRDAKLKRAGEAVIRTKRLPFADDAERKERVAVRQAEADAMAGKSKKPAKPAAPAARA